MEKKYVELPVQLKKIDKENFSFDAIMSTADKDRHGDIVEQNWELKNFKKNPVLLNSHNYNDATEVIGKVEDAKVDGGKLQGVVKFAVNENPKAKIIFDLYAGGFLNAFSVGFIPKKFDDEGKILQSELLELSAVSVPANAMALAKAKGIEVDQLYDGDKTEENINNGTDEADDSNKGSEEEREEENNTEDNEITNGGEDTKSIKKEFENWDEDGIDIRYKVRDIDLFEKGTIKKITFQALMPKIFATVGIIKGSDVEALQMVFFPKAEGWTIDDAKKWVVSNDLTWIPAELPSENMARSANQIIVDGIKSIKDEKQQALNKIIKAIRLVSEETKGETRSENVRAENNRLINKAVRSLLSLKN